MRGLDESYKGDFKSKASFVKIFKTDFNKKRLKRLEDIKVASRDSRNKLLKHLDIECLVYLNPRCSSFNKAPEELN